jgi:subtilase family serine protease
VVNENTVQVVSNSWSDVERAKTGDSIAAYEQIFLQGAVQGISFLFSSGDNGDELANTGVKQVDYPASDPYVTAIGGTSTEITAGLITSESGWGTQKYSLSADGKSWVANGFLYGAGGGYSSLFNRPGYQNGVVPASAPAGRAVPDVAMDADPNTGMLIGQTQTFPDGVRYGEYRIGGTSLASPLFAGMAALTIQAVGGNRVGLLNPLLYKAKRVFTDVKQTPSQLGVVRADYANGIDPADGILYSVRTFGQDSSLAAKPGWDPVTGLGVPNGSYLAALGGPSPAATGAGSTEVGAPER